MSRPRVPQDEHQHQQDQNQNQNQNQNNDQNRPRLIRVLSIRSDNPLGHGGCIFFGIEITEKGDVSTGQYHFVVIAPNRLLLDNSVEIGQWWRVTGEPKPNTRTVNGFRVVEQQIEAEDLQMVLPTGRHIITLLCEGVRFAGIGNAKATRLWETFGDNLTALFDRGDVDTLATVQGVTDETANTLINAWREYGSEPTLHWLFKHGFNASLGKNVITHFGADAPKLIEEDPYRLLSFLATWKTTDRFARTHFDVAEDDPRRLQGAIEEALYRLFTDGHTAVPRQMVMSRLASILGDQTEAYAWRTLAAKALETGQSNGSYLVGADDRLHQIGAYVMESTVATAIATRLKRQPAQVNEAKNQNENENEYSSCNRSILERSLIDQIISAFEHDEQVRLTEEQRSAIHMAAANPFALITGGAGTGKTIVLKALYRVYDKMGLLIIQGAVAGRAAKRMNEATKRPATTIASILLHTHEDDLMTPCVLVLDEASMVDIISMYRIAHLIPEHARILMVGDPHQLMPVGPGLVLHALVNSPQVPNTELKVVKRHGDEIARAAASIREGVWPQMSDSEHDAIAFLPLPPTTSSSQIHRLQRHGDTNSAQPTITSQVLRLYQNAPGITQILSPWKKGDGGVHSLNLLCQSQMAPHEKRLTIWNKEFECLIETKLRLNDPVVCTRNLWDIGLQNGSLGRLVQLEQTPLALVDDEGRTIGYAIAWIDWDDGIRRAVTQELLDDLELAYALTVHKAQGSQWPRIIVPIIGNRYLDRSLIYTAVTRAQQQVLLVGDEAAARRAVMDLPRAHMRHTGLSSMLLSLS